MRYYKNNIYKDSTYSTKKIICSQALEILGIIEPLFAKSFIIQNFEKLKYGYDCTSFNAGMYITIRNMDMHHRKEIFINLYPNLCRKNNFIAADKLISIFSGKQESNKTLIDLELLKYFEEKYIKYIK